MPDLRHLPAVQLRTRSAARRARHAQPALERHRRSADQKDDAVADLSKKSAAKVGEVETIENNDAHNFVRRPNGDVSAALLCDPHVKCFDGLGADCRRFDGHPFSGVAPCSRARKAISVVIAYRRFEVSGTTPEQDLELAEVRSIADAMRDELARVSENIDAIHVWRAKSDEISAAFFPWLQANYEVELESQAGFEGSTTPFNRPDAQISLDLVRPNRIIIEVERGGTVTNGHDLKDMWKTHLSSSAKHLFLVVPNSITNENGKRRADNAFNRCASRLGTFFGTSRTQIDVWSLHLFGYGPPHE